MWFSSYHLAGRSRASVGSAQADERAATRRMCSQHIISVFIQQARPQGQLLKHWGRV
jgi:hypothetical protein